MQISHIFESSFIFPAPSLFEICHIFHYRIINDDFPFSSGVGEVADVELISFEGGLEEAHLGETQDIHGAQIGRFEDCYPNVVYSKEIQIQNKV